MQAPSNRNRKGFLPVIKNLCSFARSISLPSDSRNAALRPAMISPASEQAIPIPSPWPTTPPGLANPRCPRCPVSPYLSLPSLTSALLFPVPAPVLLPPPRACRNVSNIFANSLKEKPSLPLTAPTTPGPQHLHSRGRALGCIRPRARGLLFNHVSFKTAHWHFTNTGTLNHAPFCSLHNSFVLHKNIL